MSDKEKKDNLPITEAERIGETLGHALVSQQQRMEQDQIISEYSRQALSGKKFSSLEI